MTAVSTFCLLVAMLLDKRFGEPNIIWSRIPHPVEWFGRWIRFTDESFNAGQGKKWKGVGLLVFSSVVLGLLGLLTRLIPGGELIDILLVAILLAQKSLEDHLKDVAAMLRVSLGQGRLAVAKIVGRDVSNLDSSEVSKAAIESAAEGFSDGVVAPCFWFLLLGLPGILIYKFVNTADSMIGYRNEKYNEFGWAAARTDDLLNFIPARLSAIIMLVTHWSLDRFSAVAEDASLHISPNAGWPESAMAHALDISLGGPREYQQEEVKLRYFNETGRQQLAAQDIDDSMRLIRRSHRTCLIALIILLVVQLILF